MVKLRLRTLIACAFLFCAAVSAAQPTSNGSNGQKKRYLVMSKGNMVPDALMNLVGQYRGTSCQPMRQRGPDGSSGVVVDLDPNDAAVLAASGAVALEENKPVSLVPIQSASATANPLTGASIAIVTVGANITGLTGPWANYAADTLGTPNCAPWHLDRLDQRVLPLDCKYNCNTATDNTAGVDVYVVDTGVNTALSEFLNPDGTSRATAFYAPLGSTTGDDHGHGTFVANLVGGKTYGVAKNVQIKSVKVFDSSGVGDTATLVDALLTILNDRDKTRPAIVSMSLSGDGRSALVEWYIARLLADNVLVVAAAGNAPYNSTSASDACNFSPGASPAALTVGATTIVDKMAWWSNYGACVKILAPGQDVWSVWRDGTHMALSGTSMATPLVSGAAAMLWSQLPSLSSKQVYRAVIQNAEDVAIAPTSLPVGTPRNLVNAQFSLLQAPSAADSAALAAVGVNLTPCTSAICPSSWNDDWAVARLGGAGSGRRLIRGGTSNGVSYQGRIFATVDGGQTYYLVNVWAPNRLSWAALCDNPGMYIGSVFNSVYAGLCAANGTVYLVHDILVSATNEMYFRLERDPVRGSFNSFNPLNAATYGWSSAAPEGPVVLSSDTLQNFWVYDWRTGGFFSGESGRLFYQGVDWVYSTAYRRWWTINMINNWQQFDYVMNGAVYRTFPLSFWGGGVVDYSTQLRFWRPMTTLGAAWANYSTSYSPTAFMKFRSGFSITTWANTLQSNQEFFTGWAVSNAFFVSGTDLLFQADGTSGKLTPDGVLSTYTVASGATVADVTSFGVTSTVSFPNDTTFSNAGSVFYATADLFTAPGSITGFEDNTLSLSYRFWWRPNYFWWRP